MASRSEGWMLARNENKTHQEETNANWINVRVTGLGKAFMIDLDEVLVRAEVRYQIIQ